MKKETRGRPRGSKNKNHCNCHEWAELGTYLCPVHGHYNIYRQGGEMKVEKIFNSTGLRKLYNVLKHKYNDLKRKYNDLKLRVKSLEEENKYLRNRTTKLLEKQNELLQDALDNC